MTSIRSLACERSRGYLSQRLDDELSELEGALLATHLRRCAACASYGAEIGAIVGRLRAAPLERPRTRFALPRTRLRLVRVQYGAAATAATALVGVGTLLAALTPTQGGADHRAAGVAMSTRAQLEAEVALISRTRPGQPLPVGLPGETIPA